MTTKPRSLQLSTILAIVAVLGFVGLAVINFATEPWLEFTAWAILAVVALTLSCINLFRYRSLRYVLEVAAEVVILASFQGRLLQLFGRAA